MDNRKHINKELEEISPWLAQRLESTKDGLAVPDGYFDQLEKTFENKLNKKEFSIPPKYLDNLESSVIKKLAPKKRRIHTSWAIAASLGLLFIALLGLNLNETATNNLELVGDDMPEYYLDDMSIEELAYLDIEEELNTDDDETLAQFIEQNIDQFDEELLSELLINNYE